VADEQQGSQLSLAFICLVFVSIDLQWFRYLGLEIYLREICLFWTRDVIVVQIDSLRVFDTLLKCTLIFLFLQSSYLQRCIPCGR
jgi:hypothetical protein